jgi:hypothetical protein
MFVYFCMCHIRYVMFQDRDVILEVLTLDSILSIKEALKTESEGLALSTDVLPHALF